MSNLSSSGRQLLLDRAKALAQERAADADTAASLAVVTFESAGQTVAVPVEDAREFATLGRWTAIPGVAPPYEGLVNFRGALVPLLPVKRLLGQDDAEGTSMQLLILGRERPQIALRIDAPGVHLNLAAESLRAPPPQNPSLKAVTTEGLALLDSAALLRPAGNAIPALNRTAQETHA